MFYYLGLFKASHLLIVAVIISSVNESFGNKIVWEYFES